jgi:DNA-binding transcriptional LysR family regulator
MYLCIDTGVMKNWNDIQYFLAVAKEGSMSAGGRRLGVNQSTVSRRISTLEDEMKVRLFEHLSTGYVLTQEGEKFLKIAKSIEMKAMSIDQEVTGADTRLAGNIRVTTVDSFANQILIPIVAKFFKVHPKITVDIIVTDVSVSLTQREADVALRATNSPPENLVGRCVIKGVSFATYGSKNYLKLVAPLNNFEKWEPNNPEPSFDWVGWGEEYFGPSYPKEKVRCRMNTSSTMLEAVKAGMGVAQLPCLLADLEPSLRRISPIDNNHKFDVWLLTHKDLRHTARFRVFLDFVAEELLSYRN